MKINFINSPRPRPKKLLREYTTVSGHRFAQGSLHNVEANECGQIALSDPRTGCLVFFGKSEWM